MKISKRTELMFSQAVSLAQAGRMKSSIHAYQNAIYILNMDDTIILKFKSDDSFKDKISFLADEYESSNLETKDGQVIFRTSENGYNRTKSCAAPKITFDEVQDRWYKYEKDINQDYPISFNDFIVPLLEDNLSHVELVTDPVKLIQKNIYTGERIEIKKDSGMGHLIGEKSYNGFDIIGLRTVDFKALFSLVDQITFYLQEGKNWIFFGDHSGVLEGFLSTCIYDELGYVKEN